MEATRKYDASSQKRRLLFAPLACWRFPVTWPLILVIIGVATMIVWATFVYIAVRELKTEIPDMGFGAFLDVPQPRGWGRYGATSMGAVATVRSHAMASISVRSLTLRKEMVNCSRGWRMFSGPPICSTLISTRATSNFGS